RRWLEGEPVSVHAPSLGERLGRWARKNPAVAWLLGAVAAALFLGAVVSLGFAWQARNKAAEAQQTATELGKSLARALVAEHASEQAHARIQWELQRLEIAHYVLQLDQARRLWQEGANAAAQDVLAATLPARRGWEHGHLQRLCGGPLRTLQGHAT